MRNPVINAKSQKLLSPSFPLVAIPRDQPEAMTTSLKVKDLVSVALTFSLFESFDLF